MQHDTGQTLHHPHRTASLLRKLLYFVVFSPIVATPPTVLAGGGPENVFLVYNVSDASSLTIANHYQHLRSIPAGNLFGVEWQGKKDQIPIKAFREQLLLPIITEIDRRKLSGQIDYVVYSSGFPYAVNFAADVPGEAPKFSVGSLTSLTFFFQSVLAKKTNYTAPQSNWYASTGVSTKSTTAFRGIAQWAPGGQQVGENVVGGRRYLLSAMLGYTHGRGNTTDEAIDYLTLAAAADGTFPRGEIYFMENGDVRTKTRRGQFESVVQALRQEGMPAEIETGSLPQKKSRVAGVMAGVPNFSWSTSGSQIVPGAFCDNLTSFGGVLRKGAGQTPVSEFLRHGAAGTCGTVVEPYALAAKFPHAVVQLHYFRGLNLAEAFYRSVRSPYQQLLIGDPLCQPWATVPRLRVAIESDKDDNGSLRDAIVFQPSSSAHDLQFELYLDGRLTARCQNDQKLRIDSTQLPDGYHDARVVAVASGNIASRSSKLIPLMINNRGYELAARLKNETSEQLTFDVTATQGDGIQAWCRRRLVGILDQPQGELQISRNLLGNGPAQVQMVAVSKSSRQALSFSRPIELQLTATAQHSTQPAAVGNLR